MERIQEQNSLLQEQNSLLKQQNSLLREESQSRLLRLQQMDEKLTRLLELVNNQEREISKLKLVVFFEDSD